MAMYWKEITVNWGESDPFGLVYYPRIVAWFNDTEHELFRVIGYPIDQMIRHGRTTFVMGEIHFRFIGPAAYGDRILTTITLTGIGERTLSWNCKAKNALTGAPVSEGKATRVYARINEDGTLSSQPIPPEMLSALRGLGDLTHLRSDGGARRRVVGLAATPGAGDGMAGNGPNAGRSAPAGVRRPRSRRRRGEPSGPAVG